MNENMPKPKPPVTRPAVNKPQPKQKQVKKTTPKSQKKPFQKKPFALHEHLTDRPFSKNDALKKLREQVKEGDK